MICSICKSQNPERTDFCQGCGTNLQVNRSIDTSGESRPNPYGNGLGEQPREILPETGSLQQKVDGLTKHINDCLWAKAFAKNAIEFASNYESPIQKRLNRIKNAYILLELLGFIVSIILIISCFSRYLSLPEFFVRDNPEILLYGIWCAAIPSVTTSIFRMFCGVCLVLWKKDRVDQEGKQAHMLREKIQNIDDLTEFLSTEFSNVRGIGKFEKWSHQRNNQSGLCEILFKHTLYEEQIEGKYYKITFDPQCSACKISLYAGFSSVLGGIVRSFLKPKVMDFFRPSKPEDYTEFSRVTILLNIAIECYSKARRGNSYVLQ